MRIANVYRYYVKDPNLARYYYNETVEQIRDRPEQADHQMLDEIEGYEGLDAAIRATIPNVRELVAEDRMVRPDYESGRIG